MIKLQLGDIVEIDGRIYKVHAGKWSNQPEWVTGTDKNGRRQGLKMTLKLLREKELTEFIKELTPEKTDTIDEEYVRLAMKRVAEFSKLRTMEADKDFFKNDCLKLKKEILSCLDETAEEKK